MPITKITVLKYTLLPEFFPRLRNVFTSGFMHVAYLMAVIYQSVGLLPKGHPYLRSENIGRYGIRHVIAQAANHLVFKKENIDQILIFFCILLGVVLLMAQFALLIVAIIAQQPVMAGPFSLGYELTPGTPINLGPTQDLAFILLDRIFGTVGIFDSCVANPGTPCTDLRGNSIYDPGAYPFPFHIALHQLLRFYSLGIFVVAVMVILYFIITIVSETAVAGSPFGQRLNKTWAPVRLVLFSALLVPLNIGGQNAGLNGAQILTFWVAKGGSNFATNGWGVFNEVLTSSYLGETNTLIATPNIPEVSDLTKFMFLAKVCQIAENIAHEHWPSGVQAYLVREEVKYGPPAVIAMNNWLDFRTTNFSVATQHVNKGNIFIRFGVLDPTLDPAIGPIPPGADPIEEYQKYKGAVNPVCGEIMFQTSSFDQNAAPQSGGVAIQESYYELIKTMWNDINTAKYAECVVKRHYKPQDTPNCANMPSATFAQMQIVNFQNNIDAQIPIAIAQQIANGDFSTANLAEKGWVGAAIWYNRIAQMNGAVTGAILKLPKPNRFPFVMETIAAQRMAVNENIDPSTIYDPTLKDGIDIKYARIGDKEIAIPMVIAYNFWDNDGLTETHLNRLTSNPVIDSINLLLGTHGLFEMRKNTDIHPLAQLSALGKGMMDASVRNFVMGAVGKGAGGIFKDMVGEVSEAAGKIFSSFSTVTIALAFVLYYVLPFLPFIYFLFAVSGWIKSIFEAIVAMPLWALAHIKIDGEGIPGPAAINGYHLLLEIFIRPILILIGLIAALSIFSALVNVLNEVFDLLVANAGGFDLKEEVNTTTPSMMAFFRGPVDKFFYTVMYVILVYMIGLSCFKLIDMIPQSILRWMSVSVATIQESEKDPAGKVIQQTYQGTIVATGQVKGGALAALT